MTELYLRPDVNLDSWDRLNSRGQNLVAIAGVDAHANIGLTLDTRASQTLGGILLDPYDLTFQIVRNYIVLEKGRPFDTSAVLEALANGQIYAGFDLLADASGFRFMAENESGRRIMGQQIAPGTGVLFTVVLPKFGRIVLLRNGHPHQEISSVGRQEFRASEKGVYRVEVYLDRLDKPLADHPWIISNPIYVR
jgi:hypothetical protein